VSHTIHHDELEPDAKMLHGVTARLAGRGFEPEDAARARPADADDDAAKGGGPPP